MESLLNESLNNDEEIELGQQNLTEVSDYLHNFSSDNSGIGKKWLKHIRKKF